MVNNKFFLKVVFLEKTLNIVRRFCKMSFEAQEII
jgi:hypothetical protein